MRSGAFWAGLLTGAAIGAGIALIYAPRPGEETRENVSQGVRNITDAAKKRGRAMLQRGRGKMDEISGQAEQKMADIEEATA